MLCTLFTCGLRIGEAIELRGRHVLDRSGRLHVQRAANLVTSQGFLVGLPKWGVTRQVPVQSWLPTDLVELEFGEDELLFPAAIGGRIRPRNFGCRTFTDTLQKPTAAAAAKGDSGVAAPLRMVLRDTRHTVASWAIFARANPKTDQCMSGHKTAAMTLDTYAGLFDQDLVSVVTRMAAYAPRPGAS
ncbi:tyrosine-type recombinase/integrase [Arthrobacter woluwensis]|uniref:tyrosine-type recombinase/integrase n=1 Tax=Arthrobacter woluwensis TaxID=156980 RepID=UPI003807EB33